jgi:hypothetical protein
VNKRDIRDWVIMVNLEVAVLAFIVLCFKHPDPVIVGAVCTAVPTILGLYHWFTVRDDKERDAQ